MLADFAGWGCRQRGLVWEPGPEPEPEPRPEHFVVFAWVPPQSLWGETAEPCRQGVAVTKTIFGTQPIALRVFDHPCVLATCLECEWELCGRCVTLGCRER